MSEETKNTNEDVESTPMNETFESWLDQQDESVKSLITAHTQGLSNTVKAVRTERDGLSKQLKELAAKAESGSESQKQLEELNQQLEAATDRKRLPAKHSKEFIKEAATLSVVLLLAIRMREMTITSFRSTLP